MKRVFVILIAAFIAVIVLAQNAPIKVSEILNNPKAYLDEVVTVEGFVTQYTEATAKTTSFYFLKDDWGGIIKVRTSKMAPTVGLRYRVSGPVNMDITYNEPYVSEEMRIPVTEGQHAQGVTSATPTGAVEGGEAVSNDSLLLYVLIGAIIVVFIILLLLLMWIIRRRRDSMELPAELAAEIGTGSAPQPESVVEGHTIKMHRPPEGTLKIVPGYFEVESGDDVVKEIRFYKLKEQAHPEITFGRATGPAYTHIQLKPMTVSSRQAKLVVKENVYSLTNFVGPQSNPTRINGREMNQDETVELKDKDKVEMGEVVFIFHRSQ